MLIILLLKVIRDVCVSNWKFVEERDIETEDEEKMSTEFGSGYPSGKYMNMYKTYIYMYIILYMCMYIHVHVSLTIKW